MLAKLLKYEIKATSRITLPLYLVLIVFSLFNIIVNPIELLEKSNSMLLQSIAVTIGAMLYFGLLVGIGVMTLVLMIQRFYKSLLGDEGYLMFTLPVKPWQHIVSKLLVSLLWTVSSFLVTIGSIIIINRVPDLGDVVGMMISGIKSVLGIAGFFVLPLYGLIAVTSGIMMIYTAITLGHLFSRHRLLASFGMYLLLYMVYQTVMTLCITLIGSFFLPSLFEATGMYVTPRPAVLNILIGVFACLSLLLTSASFTATNAILKKRLNLE